MARAPTARQLQVLRIVRENIAARGFPPSIREVAHDMGNVREGSALFQLKALAAKGLLERDGGPRCIRITASGLELLGVTAQQAPRRATGTVQPPNRCMVCGAAHFVARCPMCATSPVVTP